MKVTNWNLYYGNQLVVCNQPGWVCGKEKARLIKEKIATNVNLFKFKPVTK